MAQYCLMIEEKGNRKENVSESLACLPPEELVYGGQTGEVNRMTMTIDRSLEKVKPIASTSLQ